MLDSAMRNTEQPGLPAQKDTLKDLLVCANCMNRWASLAEWDRVTLRPLARQAYSLAVHLFIHAEDYSIVQRISEEYLLGRLADKMTAQ